MRNGPRRVDGVRVEEAADGFIVYQPEQEKVHYLNHTAAIVLELCSGEVTVREMAEALRQMYDLPETPLREVERCLDDLRKQGLVSAEAD
jgi:hypothetical protein